MKTETTVYNRQAAVLLFILSVTFKAAALPAMVAEEAASGGLVVLALLFLTDVTGWILLRRFIDIGGIELFDKNAKKWFKCAIMIVLSAYFVFKTILYFSQTIDFVVSYMFEHIKLLEATIVLFVPCVFLAAKGIKNIARVGEITIVMVIVVLAFNCLFIKTDADFARNLPLFNMSFGETASVCAKFCFWFGDFMPLLFVAEKRNKRNLTPWAMAGAVVFVLLTYALMFAIYGKSLVIVKNAMLKFGVFNHLETYFGRLDWTVIIIWLPMAFICGGTQLWAAGEAVKRLTGNRAVALTLASVAVFVFFLFVEDAMTATSMAKSEWGLAALTINVVVPAVLCLSAARFRKKEL